MASKFRLVDAPNVNNPALITLREKGYELGIYPPSFDSNEDVPDDPGIGHWYAKKDEHEFIAADPISLLGLVTLWEYRGNNWIREDDPDIKDELLEQIYGDE